MIVLENVTKKFGNKIAVDNLSLEINDGEFFTILGPNGAGKTTTLKMIAGLYKPTSGKIYVNGVDVQNDTMYVKRQIAFIPEEPYLYDKLTGREFLRFVGQMYQIDKQTLNRDIATMIELLDMAEFVDNLIETYSHGMKQRIVISASLLHNPSIILVDEPFIGLDPATTKTVKDKFKDLAKQGATVFMSTHLLPVAEDLSDRVAIINHGKLIAIGSMQELRKQAGSDGNLEELFFKLTS